MSIATQIQRLINAKKAIKSSIVNKSVTVADTVKLDGYGTLINQIGANANIGPNDVIKGKMAFGNNGKYFNGTALSVQTSANNARILNGFTAYDSNGQLLTGNAMPTAATAQNNKIMSGYTAYTNTGVLMQGNAFANNTNATNASLLKGHTAYLNNGFWLNGTAFGNNTTANNAMILKGYTAYLNNGFYLNGTALGNSTNALNNHILTGYTAYNSNGGWLVGTAFGNVTNATNAQILAGQRAYLNNGIWLNGTMSNYAGTSKEAGDYGVDTDDQIWFTIPSAGYYTTSSDIYYNAQDVLDELGVKRVDYDILRKTSTTTSLSFELDLDITIKGFCVFLQPDTVDFETDGSEDIVVSIMGYNDELTTSYQTFDAECAYASSSPRMYIRKIDDLIEARYYNGTLRFRIDTDVAEDAYFLGEYRVIYFY